MTSLNLDLVRQVLKSAGVDFIAIGSARAGRLREASEMTDPKPEQPKAGLGPISQARHREEVRIKVDAYIAAQPEPRPSRPEAIRRLLAEALAMEADARRSQRQMASADK